MSADYPMAQEHFVPRNFMFNTNGHIAIVIHKTGGDATPQAVYNTFINSGNPGKSSHYAIGQDGTIWQFVPEVLGAGANGIPDGTMEAFWQPYVQQYGNLNECTLSIEHCDPSPRNDTPLTSAQKQASFALVAYLCKKYNIPASHIKPHNSICTTDCPGTYPMAELIAYIRQGGNMPIPTGWKQVTVNGETRLVAPNGHYAVAGFEQAIENAATWDAGNQPNEEEYTTPQVLLHNPAVGPGSRQTYRDGFYWWTEAKGVVWEPFSGLELKACYDLIASQQAEIAKLQAAPTTPMPNVADAVSQIEAAQAANGVIGTALGKALTDLKQ